MNRYRLPWSVEGSRNGRVATLDLLGWYGLIEYDGERKCWVAFLARTQGGKMRPVDLGSLHSTLREGIDEVGKRVVEITIRCNSYP